MRDATPPAPDAVLFYDGVCGLCHRTVRGLMALDRGGALAYAPLQGDTARALFARHPALAGEDSVVLVLDHGGPGERALLRSAAVLAALARCGGAAAWCAAIARIVPRRLRDRLYDAVAGRRSRWFGRFDRCAIPRVPRGRSPRLLP